METIRLYKYCGSLEHTLAAIRDQHLKVATGADINDPFEILPLSLPEKGQRKFVRDWRAKFFEETGIISFSETWSNPLMWSHYARNHTSLCLGFDVEAAKVLKVDYIKEMKKADFEQTKKGKSLFVESYESAVATKSIDWKYEQEHRILVNLNGLRQANSQLYFLPMSERMRLREVIIGARSEATVEDVEDAIGGLSGVTITQSRLAFHSFKVTEQENRKYWNHRK